MAYGHQQLGYTVDHANAAIPARQIRFHSPTHFGHGFATKSDRGLFAAPQQHTGGMGSPHSPFMHPHPAMAMSVTDFGHSTEGRHVAFQNGYEEEESRTDFLPSPALTAISLSPDMSRDQSPDYSPRMDPIDVPRSEQRETAHEPASPPTSPPATGGASYTRRKSHLVPLASNPNLPQVLFHRSYPSPPHLSAEDLDEIHKPTPSWFNKHYETYWDYTAARKRSAEPCECEHCTSRGDDMDFEMDSRDVHYSSDEDTAWSRLSSVKRQSLAPPPLPSATLPRPVFIKANQKVHPKPPKPAQFHASAPSHSEARTSELIVPHTDIDIDHRKKRRVSPAPSTRHSTPDHDDLAHKLRGSGMTSGILSTLGSPAPVPQAMSVVDDHAIPFAPAGLDEVVKLSPEESARGMGRKNPPVVTWKGTPLSVPSDAEGYDHLTPAELHTCAVLRIWPAQYLHMKGVVVAGNRRPGGIRKAECKKYFRIDVNKTGKLYDWFVGLGWVDVPLDE